MPRRSKRSLKAISQHIERGKGFGSCIKNISTSSLSTPANRVHYLSSLKYCKLCAPVLGYKSVSEEFIDLVGEDIDNFFDEDDQSSSDGEDDDKILPEHVANFWKSTIDWGNANKRDYEQYFRNAIFGLLV